MKVVIRSGGEPVAILLDPTPKRVEEVKIMIRSIYTGKITIKEVA